MKKVTPAADLQPVTDEAPAPVGVALDEAPAPAPHESAEVVAETGTSTVHYEGGPWNDRKAPGAPVVYLDPSGMILDPSDVQPGQQVGVYEFCDPPGYMCWHGFQIVVPAAGGA